MTLHTEHRPLQAYIDALAEAGFVIQRIREVTEPKPGRQVEPHPVVLARACHPVLMVPAHLAGP